MESEKCKVFIDSNVFISGLYSSESNPGKIMNYFIRGKIDVFISQKVLNEIVRVISEKIPRILPVLRKFLASYPPGIIKDPGQKEIKKWYGIINKDDALILEAAISSGAEYLITGDKHFFNNKVIKKSGINVIRPSEFVMIINIR